MIISGSFSGIEYSKIKLLSESFCEDLSEIFAVPSYPEKKKKKTERKLFFSGIMHEND